MSLMIGIFKSLALIIVGSLLVFAFSCSVWYAGGGGDIIKW